MVSVFLNDLENKVDKLAYKKVGGHAADDKNKFKLPAGKLTMPDQSSRD